MYSGGPFEGGSLLDLTGIEEGHLEVTDIEVFDASQKHLRKYLLFINVNFSGFKKTVLFL